MRAVRDGLARRPAREGQANAEVSRNVDCLLLDDEVLRVDALAVVAQVRSLVRAVRHEGREMERRGEEI